MTATIYNTDGSVNGVYSSTDPGIRELFDGKYEGAPVSCVAGQTIKITIDLDENKMIIDPIKGMLD